MPQSSPDVSFSVILTRPGGQDSEAGWAFARLPSTASDSLASRGLVSVVGTIQGCAFRTTLQPDGAGGHWLKVEQGVMQEAGIGVGDEVDVSIQPCAAEPEPDVPDDFAGALAGAPAKASQVWQEITPLARRDWIHWVTSGKKAETRVKRIATACDMLSKGKRRPCCFDRSGMYSGSLGCPVADANQEP